MNELNITPDQKRALSIIFAVMIGLGSFYYFNSRPTEQVSQALIEIPTPAETITTQLIINVAGKVTNPGVYQLPQGSRVIDAIKAAGNQLRGVDISDINLARVLVDGEQILVGPTKNYSSKSKPRKVTIDNPLDINRATIAQLDTLPGKGWQIVNCDVGQGDGLVINLGKKSAIVIDTGPDSKAIDQCLKSLKIREIPLLILTHFHADHVGAISAVLENRVIGEVWISNLYEPEAAYEVVMKQLSGKTSQ